MKNTSLTTRLMVILPALTVLIYFGAQARNYFTSPVLISPVYTYRAEQVLTLSGYAVRDETVVDCAEPLVELNRAEGERVARGGRIATVYQSAEALEAERRAASLRAQLGQLRIAQSAANDTEAALRLDSEIVRGIVALRAALAKDDFTASGSAASALESLVLRREYAYLGAGDLTERIAALEAELFSAQSAAGGSAQTVAAPFAGTYSALADGYEQVLTPAALETMTPEEFERVAPEPVNSTVGRLIRGEAWYYVAAVNAAEARDVAEGQQLELAVSGVETPLPVTVARLSGESGGRRLLVLRGDAYLSSVTMLRRQSAELILARIDGLRVPKNALRIDENGRTGVYCRIGRQAWFKPVTILYQGEDFCLVQAGSVLSTVDSDFIFYSLRVGDEVIVSAQNLYNGKVLDG